MIHQFLNVPFVICVLTLCWGEAAFANDTSLPSNRTDKIQLGYYGGIKPSEHLQPAISAVTCYDMVRRSGVDWLWLQGPCAMPDDELRDAVLELKKQVRIVMRMHWWRHPSYDAKYYANGYTKGPDWIDLADDPVALETTHNIIEKALADFFEHCGEDALYGITLSEEVPMSTMYTGKRDVHWIADHRAESSEKIIEVSNKLYRRIKQRYPKLQVFSSCYPGQILGRAEKMLDDGVMMTCFPSEAFNPGKLKRMLRDFRQAYPPAPNVYVYFRGDAPGVADRDVAIANHKQIFKAFYAAGYRNIGWFGSDNQTVLFDHIQAQVAEMSPGTYLGTEENRVKMLAVDLVLRAETDAVFAQLGDRVPEAVREQAAMGRQLLDQAQQADGDAAGTLLAQSRTQYHAAIDQTVRTADPIRLKLAFAHTLDQVIEHVGLDTSPLSASQLDAPVPAAVLAKGTTFAFLPGFYEQADRLLPAVERKHDAVMGLIESKIKVEMDVENPNPHRLRNLRKHTVALTAHLKAWRAPQAIAAAQTLGQAYGK